MNDSMWIPVFLALIVAAQAVSVALIQRGRKADKEERAEVALKVKEVVDVANETRNTIVETSGIVKQTHEIANSRYDEIKDQLLKSNEELKLSNEHVIKLLEQMASGRRGTGDRK
jgi:hypothetical protein